MMELNNPDWTKTNEEIDKIKEQRGWIIWWNVKHQYPYQSRTVSTRRVWLNPFYLPSFSKFWVITSE